MQFRAPEGSCRQRSTVALFVPRATSEPIGKNTHSERGSTKGAVRKRAGRGLSASPLLRCSDGLPVQRARGLAIEQPHPARECLAAVCAIRPAPLTGALRGVPARRGPARPVRDSTVGEGFPPQTVWDEDGNSTIRTLEARCEGFRLWLEIKCPGGMQSRDHRGIRAPCSRSWRKNRGARGPRHGIAADWPRRTPSSDAIPILAVASVLPGERLQR